MGMARSGTSLIAALLQRLGLFLGERRFGADEEATLFYRLNAIMLRQIHGEFDNPAPMRYFLRDAGAVELTVKCLEADLRSYRILSYLGVRRYLKYRSIERYDQPWGWKDPLNTQTLPVWLRLFPQAKIVYLYRNGVDVARSLVALQQRIISQRQIRNQKKSARFSTRRHLELFGFKGAVRCASLEGSFSLWEEFVSQAEQTLSQIGNPRMAIRYEDFLADPKTHLTTLRRFCELPDSGSLIDEISRSVDARRSHAFLADPALRSFYARVRDTRWMLHYGYRGLEGDGSAHAEG
jgi:hypothetical protein